MSVDANDGAIPLPQARVAARSSQLEGTALPQAFRAGQGSGGAATAIYDPLPLLLSRTANTAGLERRVNRPGAG